MQTLHYTSGTLILFFMYVHVCMCMYGILELAMRVELKICKKKKKKALGNWNSNLGVGHPRGSPPCISGVNKHNSITSNVISIMTIIQMVVSQALADKI